MNNAKARFVLQSYRGNADVADPMFGPALQETSQDPELGQWFAEAQRFDRAVSGRLRSIPVPAGLNESILAGLETPTPLRRPIPLIAPLAIAASVLLLAAAALVWFMRPPATDSLAEYRREMVTRLEGRVVLNVQSENPAELRQWLNEQRGLAVQDLPAGLQGRRSIGCRAWTYNGQTAGLICFVLEGGQPVHLFVVPRGALPNSPETTSTQFAQVGQWQTASWSRDGMVYVLAARTDRDSLARLL